jgi:hypothetical protein
MYEVFISTKVCDMMIINDLFQFWRLCTNKPLKEKRLLQDLIELKKIIYNHHITNLCRNKNLIHEELQVFNSIKTHHISSTSTIMKDLYYDSHEQFNLST